MPTPPGVRKGCFGKCGTQWITASWKRSPWNGNDALWKMQTRYRSSLDMQNTMGCSHRHALESTSDKNMTKTILKVIFAGTFWGHSGQHFSIAIRNRRTQQISQHHYHDPPQTGMTAPAYLHSGASCWSRVQTSQPDYRMKAETSGFQTFCTQTVVSP